MPVPPDYMIYGDGELNPDFHDPDLERRAADLWRADNPNASVFACDEQTKAVYRRRAMEAWRPREQKWDWRRFLTAEERETLSAAEAAKLEWLKLNRERAAIVNRAIQRAKYAAHHGAQ